MDRYRYFLFNQRGIFVLGILQIGCAGVCVVSGFVDSTFRKDSILSRTRAPVWAGTFMGFPGVLALFSSQKRNPTLVNSMIGSGVISCFTTTIVILYAALTLSYGEDDDEVFHHKPSYIIHAEYILSKLVEGANMAILISSVFGLMIATVIAYLGCRSLPNCACYDSTTGMHSLLIEERHPQMIELVCTWQGASEQRILNDPVQLKDWDLDTEEAELSSKLSPYVRLA